MFLMDVSWNYFTVLQKLILILSIIVPIMFKRKRDKYSYINYMYWIDMAQFKVAFCDLIIINYVCFVLLKYTCGSLNIILC